jgi:hypothetical protein
MRIFKYKFQLSYKYEEPYDNGDGSASYIKDMICIENDEIVESEIKQKILEILKTKHSDYNIINLQVNQIPII